MIGMRSLWCRGAARQHHARARAGAVL